MNGFLIQPKPLCHPVLGHAKAVHAEYFLVRSSIFYIINLFGRMSSTLPAGRTDSPGQETVLKFIIHGNVHMVGLGIFCKFTLIPQRNAEVFMKIQSLGDGKCHGIPLP